MGAFDGLASSGTCPFATPEAVGLRVLGWLNAAGLCSLERMAAAGPGAFDRPAAAAGPGAFGGSMELVLGAFGTPELARPGAFDAPAVAAGPGALGGPLETALGAFG